MSVESMSLVLHHSRSKGTDRLVLVGIANHDGDGGAWPSVEKLMRYTGMAERTVQNAIKALIKLGELEVHYNAGGTHTTRADRRPNRYEILVRCPAGCDGTKDHRVTQDGVQSAAPRELDGVQPATERGAARSADGVQPAAPEPSLEPSMNQPSASTAPPPKPRRASDPLWDAVIAACGLSGETPTKAARGGWNAAVADLRRAGATPQLVQARAAAFRDSWPNGRLTPTLLARRWNELAIATPTTPTAPQAEPRPGPATPASPIDQAAAQGRALAITDLPDEELSQHCPWDPELGPAFRAAFEQERARQRRRAS